VTTVRRNRELDDVAAGERASVRHRAARRTAPVGGGLDRQRLKFCDLATRLSLIAGPLRLLDGDFSDRDFNDADS
jgi:hypothetical protein